MKIHMALDGTFAYRMQQVETGLKELDTKVSRIDDKMNHVIDLQEEHAQETKESLSGLRSSLEMQRDELARWQRHVRQQQPMWKTVLAVVLLITWVVWMVSLHA
jgi:FtsZ-binding cell division protein ZapB